jgi:type IX secretion system PorP/SprF family membrane protein
MVKFKIKLFVQHYIQVFFCVFICVISLTAQDIHYSQFYMSPLILNPATAGAFKDINATANYRNQWNSVSSPYKTYAIAGDMKIVKEKWQNAVLGVGLNVFNDRTGDGSLNTAAINISIASHLKLNEQQIFSLGLNGGLGQRSLNFSSLTWDNQFNGFSYDATLPTGENLASSSYFFPDFGGGILYQFHKNETYISSNDQLQANIGFSVSHVNQPRFSFYSSTADLLYMKYVSHGNMLVGIKNTPFSLVPGFVYYKQGPAEEVMLGSLIRYTLREESKYTTYVKGSAIEAGAYYRWNDAIVIVTLLEMANYAIGVSYDITVSDLRKASTGRGGFEISLRYVSPSNFLNQNKAK